MHKFPKFYGLVRVGARGQVVIPKEVRKMLTIKAGDKLIVTSGHPGKKMVGFFPADDFSQFLSHFEKHISTLKAEISNKN
ncbi:MAG: AbrB/MazE/SpoVT family DNA-binding domain-containing protein [Candidatus Omnitrophota bacterium]|nr:MAG: AbrB/MazE/SpoVT family DNA-binding domain-containing protein [Candidatus Omnitrophota bacterium]